MPRRRTLRGEVVTAYTDAAAISTQLGVALTSGDQQLAAERAAAAATQWIDDYKGQSWQSATILNETHRTPCPGPGWADGGTVYLKTRPVVSVEEVRRRPMLVNATAEVLTTDKWELFDPATGMLLVKLGWDDLLQVDYTVGTVLPANISLAATLLAARFLGSLLQPGSAGLESVSVGQGELAVKFAQFQQTNGLPPEVLTLLGGRMPILA